MASFTYLPSTPHTGETVTFNASGSYDSDGSIASYFWDFGDGTNSTGVVATHAYTDNGVYTITLTVTDNDGLTDTVTQGMTVLNRSPVASFTESATSAPTGTAIQFNASNSYDPDGTIVSYFWDFGDGTNGTGIFISHVYADDADYVVTLTITDNDGATDTVAATKTVLNRLPIASFTESVVTAYVGESITFNSSGGYDPDGSIVSYFWTFGDGTNATEVIVDHAYADDGAYTVTLTVTDDDGATASASATKTILNKSPIALFTESAENVLTQQVITFNASASYDSDGSIVSYFWYFGDGTNASGVVVQHAYSDNGAHNVTLTVTDDDAATGTARSTKTVSNRSPVASFTESAATVYIGQPIAFNASSSYDPDGTIASDFWTFGDGTNATDIVTSHTYSSNGTFTVTLMVTDNDGATNTKSATKTILYNNPPVALFTESAETVYTGDGITFNASGSYDSDGSIVSYFWTFGDSATATGIVVTRAYVDDGTHMITLTVTDNLGAIGSSSVAKTVLNRMPIASFTESTETVFTGETIYFSASSSYDSDGFIISYFWTFGDGTNATGVTASHTYNDNGIYSVALTVTDNDGATSSTTAAKTVTNRTPVASFTESASAVYTGTVINFTSPSYDPDGAVISHFWTFGDGTNGTGITVSHSYLDNGVHTVTLTVTDDDGATAVATATKTISNRAPVASFTESTTTAYTGEVITFNASFSYDQDGSIVSYFWTFGDGANASGATVSHSYVENNAYTVTLTVTDNDGGTETATATKTILNRLPAASFTESAGTVLTQEVIHFNAAGSYDPDGAIVTYFWTFGDGTNATGVTVDHAYGDSGIYTATLTITDNDGGTASSSATKIVLNRPPVASFTESATTVYTHSSITFSATASYDPDGTIASYTWNFGDGNITTVANPGVTHAYADDGTYNVTMTIADNDGATSSATATKSILNGAPIASFTETSSTVLTGEIVSFNATMSYDSDGTITSFVWTFGDGTNASGVAVTHSYVDNGTYTVTLSIRDNDGAMSTSSAVKTVLNRSPVASFTESETSVYTGVTITFNASASYDSDGYIIDRFWDFGDGTNFTGTTVSHVYADDGVYTVTLAVTDDDGSASASTATKTVLNRAPSASFTESAVTALTNEVIYFNASTSYDTDGIIVTYFWTFGDGTNATGVTVSHSNVDNGVYTVTLTVTDDDGATATATATKTISNRPPLCMFTESAYNVYTGTVITFDASSSYDPDGTIVTYLWNFGDGNTTIVTNPIIGHSYSEDGVYTATLTVTDNDGATSSSSSTKTVLNRPPIAAFTHSPSTPSTGQPVTFDAATSYDPDGSVVSYTWDFGDGNTTTIATSVITHTYTDNGVFTVMLTVTDNDGLTDTETRSVTVSNRIPVASFTESATTTLTNMAISFDASSSYDPDGSIVSYFWDFGDDSNATGVTANHTYTDNGTYMVTLTATDNDGTTNTATATKTILNRSPIASFTENAISAPTGTIIYFNASASYDPDGAIIGYFWDFGDTTNATGITVNHAYADDGTYTVTLRVSDDDGVTTMATATKTILNRAPAASFTESATTVYTGEVITFNASASYDLDGTVLSYLWSFGDGTNANGVVVMHAYSDNGTYVVVLTVTDDDGATTSTSSTKTALNRSPIAIFTESAETVNTGDVISFNASSSYDQDGIIASYFWTFGDGINMTGMTVNHAYVDDDVYTVTLTVTDDDGATATSSAIKTVRNRLPIASFVESATMVYTNEVISFDASGSYDSDGSIIGYFWSFGDGANATSMTANHAYIDNGTYLVILAIIDDDGATETITATKTVVNRPPVSSFTENATTILTGVDIRLNASGSYDPDGTVTSYLWTFGDGANATGVVVDHIYTENGAYTVTLAITDNDGTTATSSATKTVLNRSPVGSFTESAVVVYTGESIILNASSSYDLDGIIISYWWDFGDGANATGIIVSHFYVGDGSYEATLVVTDDDSATESVTATKTVLNKPPVALFTESAETVYIGEAIQFNASNSYDSDGNIASYSWTFGDGATATGKTPTHAYALEGTYAVTLVVTDNDGAISSTSATKMVLNNPPVAAFTESAQSVYTGKTINFDASNSYDPDGTIAGYFWSFGDGATASGTTVGHAYSNNGNFTVTLTVTDNDGSTDTATSVKTVLNKTPIASFTVSATQVYTGTTVNFDASESYDSDGIVVAYFWTFGDGANATGMTASHAYADDGSYVTTLVATDDDGATGTSSITIRVLNRLPVASFTESATTVNTGEVVNLNAMASYDPDGTIASYFWSFGDGTNATGVTVGHAYIDDGSYTVTLTVTDDNGATRTATATKNVLNRSPVASFTESGQTVVVGEIIYFSASTSYDPDGSIVSYFWDFGDGSNFTGVTTQHAYSASRVYMVVLTITDDDGAVTSQSATKAVEVTAPLALFTESAQTAYTGETVTLNASGSYDPDGYITQYFWTFGDGSNASGMTVTHAYAENGIYTVSLTVTDNDGATDIASATKSILNRPPVTSFTESAQTVYMGQPIIFDASSSYDPDGLIASYFWAFGDGPNATGIVAEHTYSENGTYTVTLTLTDDDGTSTSASAAKTILWNEKPVASFVESAQTLYTGEAIYFDASASYDLDGSISSYFWDFGDGSNSAAIVANHTYVDNGGYTVTLTVTDDVGARSTSTSTKVILNRSPVASFTESSTTVYTGETIMLNASGSYDLDGTIVDFLWDFGDGTNASGVIISHSYADNGTYTVALTVADDNGAQNSTTATKIVLNSPPVAAFTESEETIHTGQSIVFNASSSYDPDGYVVSYFWDFGDGSNFTGVVVEHAYSISGVFTVTLNVTDEEGSSASVTATKTIVWNEPAVPLFTESAQTIYQGETIAFNASNSYDSDGSIVSYFWAFGDGTNATGITAEHLYSDDGNYAATLTIADSMGAISSVNATKTVLNKIPAVLFTESSTIVYTLETITFNASGSYDPDGAIVSYLWAFGDGANSSGPVAQHTFANNGQYTVTLTLTDNDGAIVTASATKTVLNRYPVAAFTVSPATIYTGQTVKVDASTSYDTDGSIIGYFWDFGDGTIAGGKIANHVYSENRQYTITLTVTDNDIAMSTKTQRITVLNRSPAASFVESAQTTYVGASIAFDASGSYDSDGSIVSYSWIFGDGATTAGIRVNHIYTVTGTYTVTLTVADNDGGSSSVQASKTILANEFPVASFTESQMTAYTSEPLAFDASSSYDPDGSIVSYLWNFGDGSSVLGSAVDHTYTDNGNYVVTLTVADNRGATDTCSATKTILNRAPVASFTESVESAYAGEPIAFDASSSYDPDGHISNYFWDFGDGTNAFGATVNHTFLLNRTFTATLTVTDNDGASGSVQATKTILGGLRDVAVTDVIPAAPEVYKHEVLDVQVVVANQGTEFETINLTLYKSVVQGWHLVEMDERLLWYSNSENSADFLLFTSVTIPTDNPTLTFETRYDTENLYDFCFVQISTDGGETWVSLENAYTTRSYSPDTDPDIFANLPGLTGTSTDWPEWRTMTFNLSSYAGETVLLGFRYMTDLGYSKEGWYVDNVTVNEASLPNQAFAQLDPSPLEAIETQTIDNLAPGAQTTLTFHWNTTSTLSGRYSISAIASPVRAEIDTGDNFYANGVVEVKANPDIDGDGDVDIFDVVAIASIYGCREGEARWNARADLVEDKVINIFDVVALASSYGKKIVK
ncbi:MAG: PKD domain-containing protein [Candidatus Bathyarchaeia archaeon]